MLPQKSRLLREHSDLKDELLLVDCQEPTACFEEVYTLIDTVYALAEKAITLPQISNTIVHTLNTLPQKAKTQVEQANTLFQKPITLPQMASEDLEHVHEMFDSSVVVPQVAFKNKHVARKTHKAPRKKGPVFS